MVALVFLFAYRPLKHWKDATKQAAFGACGTSSFGSIVGVTMIDFGFDYHLFVLNLIVLILCFKAVFYLNSLATESWPWMSARGK